jgi:hypothetical protein
MESSGTPSIHHRDPEMGRLVADYKPSVADDFRHS